MINKIMFTVAGQICFRYFTPIARLLDGYHHGTVTRLATPPLPSCNVPNVQPNSPLRSNGGRAFGWPSTPI